MMNENTDIEEILAPELSESYSILEEEVNRVLNELDIEDSLNEPSLVDVTLANAHKEIPENSDSLLVDVTTSRFSSAIWYNKIQNLNVLLAGVGGIGSYVGFLLSRVRPSSIFLHDPDIVEESNLSGQFYCSGDCGKSKVESLATLMQSYSRYYGASTFSEEFTELSPTSNIMICGFDNMKARKVFFNSWKKHIASKTDQEKGECLFIDGRLAAEEFQVLCIKGDDVYNINRYESEFLFTDAEADPTICSYKQTTFMANMIGSIIVNLFVNFAANQCNPLVDRDLPFYTEYNAETMYFKTIA